MSTTAAVPATGHAPGSESSPRRTALRVAALVVLAVAVAWVLWLVVATTTHTTTVAPAPPIPSSVLHAGPADLCVPLPGANFC